MCYEQWRNSEEIKADIRKIVAKQALKRVAALAKASGEHFEQVDRITSQPKGNWPQDVRIAEEVLATQ